MPSDPSQRVFDAPWEAEVFAFVVRLHERGLFTWTEWAAALQHVIALAEQRDGIAQADSSYHHWLTALETLLEQKGVAEPGQLAALALAWERAARSTPHGQPIQLSQAVCNDIVR